MLFSLCHTSARPQGWQAARAAWIANCVHPSRMEYILCMDRRWGFTDEDWQAASVQVSPDFDVYATWNQGRQCMVDGYRKACALAQGEVLILVSDDMFPCPRWDEALVHAMGPRIDPDFVVQVSSGTHADERGLMVLQILSRSRYERLGYALYPEYDSMYADDDFSEHARHDGVVIDARDLLFPHQHALQTEWDAVYAHQNRAGSYALGAEILRRRRTAGFAPLCTRVQAYA